MENTEDESNASSEISYLELERFSSQKIVKRKITDIEEGIHYLFIICIHYLLIYMLKLKETKSG